MTNPHLPDGWKRVAFNIVDHGKLIHFDLTKEA
jgi:trehalose/maltose hydrolase-like predicted phosphorylase